MCSLLDILKIGAGGLAGLFAGHWLARRNAHRPELIKCYAEYFSQVLRLTVEGEAASAPSCLSLIWRSSRELELLESDWACIRATGLLLGRCHHFASVLTRDGGATAASLTRLRTELSETYATTLRVVRQRLGSSNELP